MDRFLLGAAMPDFAAMGRFRLTSRPDDPSVAAGIDLHHRTDDLFHSHQWFRQHSKAVSGELEAAGIGRGAAKACGHVGVELLLDGQLLDEDTRLRPAVERAVSATTDPAVDLERVVDEARRSEWQDHLGSVARWPLPQDYRDPEAVAERLRRILSRRPRLAFERHHVTMVSRTLARHQAALESGSARLLADLEQSLSR